MPTYDYECAACGETCEIFQKITDEPETRCPSCGKKRLKRLIGGGGGFIFKGSGFYITDYRSEDYKKRAKAESESGSSDKGKSSEKSSESKPSKGGADSGGSGSSNPTAAAS